MGGVSREFGRCPAIRASSGPVCLDAARPKLFPVWVAASLFEPATMMISAPTPAPFAVPLMPAPVPTPSEPWLPLPSGPAAGEKLIRAAADDEEDEEDLGDEEDLSVSQPPVEEDSGFEDFDDEFDDDFEEDDNDPDWDHPDDAEPNGPAPPKGTGKKK